MTVAKNHNCFPGKAGAIITMNRCVLTTRLAIGINSNQCFTIKILAFYPTPEVSKKPPIIELTQLGFTTSMMCTLTSRNKLMPTRPGKWPMLHRPSEAPSGFTQLEKYLTLFRWQDFIIHHLNFTPSEFHDCSKTG